YGKHINLPNMKELNQSTSSTPHLFELIKKKIGKNATTVDQPLLPQPMDEKKSGASNRMRFLRVIPWILFATFFTSFFYDLNGKSISIGQTVLYLDNLL